MSIPCASGSDTFQSSDPETRSSISDDRITPEMFWVKHQPFLASEGYMLRPRYHPNWTPSWIRKDGTTRWRFRASFEDEHSLLTPRVLDAVRMKDGVKVVIRITRTDTASLSMAKRLCSSDKPRNHTVPILEVIPIPDDEDQRVFMVMPMLKLFHEPEFHCRPYPSPTLFDILIDFYLQGLVFMHSLNVAHGDVSPLNFLMDSAKVCPKGYHYVSETSYDGIHWSLPVRPRYRIGPIQYYIIDFESAQEYPAGKETALTTRNLRCGIRSSPEFSLGEPCNPFKLDVYNAGATFFELCEVIFLPILTVLLTLAIRDIKDWMTSSLLLDMMSEDPLARPDIEDALRRLDNLVSLNDKLWLRGKIWRLCAWVKPPSHLIQYLRRKFPVLLPYF
ncbi:kinase-like domain-containing protein [Armillaria borealis]|uniref:Kinase-like domain-containing protein n=1 Tax=Armillaria borealis TaxID=47425 RepID=A0AA39JGW9_9AGAR|nr:kinase-like domain-containing protein [Armillaria borealis]